MAHFEVDMQWREDDFNDPDTLTILMDEAEDALRKTLLSVEGEWKRLAAPSRRTGHYLRNIHSHVSSPAPTLLIGRVYNNLNYAAWLEHGTGLYGPRKQVIRPVRARALRFPQPGNAAFTAAGRQRAGRAGSGARWVYATFVRGIKPQHYAARARANTMGMTQVLFREAGRRAAARIQARSG